MNVLSDRLQAVADMVTPGNVVADIGCDHAYLPIYLRRMEVSPYVYACDVNSGPVAIAKENVIQAGLNDSIACLLGDGLKPVSGKQIDTIVIAGMGGRLMMRILSEGASVVKRAQEIVLEPQSEVSQLRFFLEKQGFNIISEDMVLEDGKFYPIIKVIHGEMHLNEEVFYRYGKIPLREGHPVLHEFLIKEKSYFAKLLNNMSEHIESADVRARIEEIEIDLKICEKALIMISDAQLNSYDIRIDS